MPNGASPDEAMSGGGPIAIRYRSLYPTGKREETQIQETNGSLFFWRLILRDLLQVSVLFHSEVAPREGRGKSRSTETCVVRHRGGAATDLFRVENQPIPDFFI